MAKIDPGCIRGSGMCVYAAVFSAGTYYCNYIGIAGHSRGCAPGAGCVVYQGDQAAARQTSYAWHRTKKEAGMSVKIKSGVNWEAVDRDIAEGMKITEAAEKHGVDKGTIYQHRYALKKAGKPAPEPKAAVMPGASTAAPKVAAPTKPGDPAAANAPSGLELIEDQIIRAKRLAKLSPAVRAKLLSICDNMLALAECEDM